MSEGQNSAANEKEPKPSESPKKGRTLSTSTSSFEALDPHDPNISRLANTMFQKCAEFLLGELTSTQEDYNLLENMNRVGITKYSDMQQIASKITTSMKEIDEKYKELQPYLDQINQIEDSVNKLEQAAYKLDAYSKRLENQYKNLLKKIRSAPCTKYNVNLNMFLIKRQSAEKSGRKNG